MGKGLDFRYFDKLRMKILTFSLGGRGSLRTQFLNIEDGGGTD